SQALLRRGSPSVFENMALAASYNLARRELPNDAAFAAVRPVLERALRAIRPVWSGSDHHYFNKYLVEAVAWLELVRTGLHSSELTGPDGDLAYYGRSQEEAWALGLTAYGAEVAVDGASEDQARRYRALAVRAMQRLSDSYPVGPEGLWITPATAQNLKAARR